MTNAHVTPPACTQCGLNPRRPDHRGDHDGLCESCEKARLQEIHDIHEHYEKHPDECCCHTYLGRHCCKAPIHGEFWKVNGISDGVRFCFIIRARDRNEAIEVGTEACLSNGEECISVRKYVPDLCPQCDKECGRESWRLKGIKGHFCSEDCCDQYWDALQQARR